MDCCFLKENAGCPTLKPPKIAGPMLQLAASRDPSEPTLTSALRPAAGGEQLGGDGAARAAWMPRSIAMADMLAACRATNPAWRADALLVGGEVSFSGASVSVGLLFERPLLRTGNEAAVVVGVASGGLSRLAGRAAPMMRRDLRMTAPVGEAAAAWSATGWSTVFASSAGPASVLEGMPDAPALVKFWRTSQSKECVGLSPVVSDTSSARSLSSA